MRQSFSRAGLAGSRLAVGAVALLLAATAAQAARMFTEDPPPGLMRQGEVAYIDNGKCPAGQVVEVTGGSTGRDGGGVVKRKYRCVPRPG